MLTADVMPSLLVPGNCNTCHTKLSLTPIGTNREVTCTSPTHNSPWKLVHYLPNRTNWPQPSYLQTLRLGRKAFHPLLNKENQRLAVIRLWSATIVTHPLQSPRAEEHLTQWQNDQSSTKVTHTSTILTDGSIVHLSSKVRNCQHSIVTSYLVY